MRLLRNITFQKHAKDLTLTEAALLAGLPKGPVAFSPLLNPDRALRRRNLVISEMESDGVITHAQAEAGAQRSARPAYHAAGHVTVAPWFQEEVRRELEKQFGTEEVHEAGLRVDTTLDLDLQQTANQRRCAMAWPPTSAATAGTASSKTFCRQGADPRRLPASRLGHRHAAPATTFMPWSRACCRSKSTRASAPDEQIRIVLLPAGLAVDRPALCATRW